MTDEVKPIRPGVVPDADKAPTPRDYLKSSADIRWLPVITPFDIDPDRVLTKAVGQLQCAIVVGYDHDDGLYFASSIGNAGTVMWLLENLKKRLME